MQGVVTLRTFYPRFGTMVLDPEKELKRLYSDRLKDRRQSKSKRRLRGEASPQALSNLLPSYFSKNPETMTKIETSRALIAWSKYVGDSAAAQSQAIRLRAGTLTVKVTSPLWMQQLSLLKGKILQHYRRDFPGLKIKKYFFH